MDTDANRTSCEADRSSSVLVDMLLSPFDELVELDYVHNRMRSLRHTEGKLFVPLTGAKLGDIRRYCAEHMIHPDDRERYLRESDPEATDAHMREGSLHGGVYRTRFRFRQLGGGWRWMEQAAIAGRENGVPDGVCYVFFYDVQDQMEDSGGPSDRGAEEARDEMTGLLTKNAFFRLGRAVLQERAEGWCMLALDLEHFKLFNDWYGREQGDLLLSQIGARLLRAEEELGALGCYFGQDDFALLLPHEKAEIDALYDDIHGLIKDYGTSVGFLPAFGVAAAESGVGVEDLYDRAALASRRAKDDYHARIRLFEPIMYKQTEKDYQILSDFQKALEDHELFFQLQPQCQIATGRVVGAESLVRWRKANGELVPPGVFVPVLERYGFVTDLDKYIWEEVCAWQKHWIDGGHAPVPISVNVSQIDIYTIDVPAYFERLIEKYELPVGVLKIEITESAYVDNESVSNTVQRLRDKGFIVLMDDFGSGYSSLNMLRNLNVDIIKLDAQFLRMNSADRKGVQIMESIVNMSKTMGVPVIVEGVETREESDFLTGLGCHYVQGYYFYRPMPVKEFERLIANPHHIDTRGVRFKGKEQFRIREFMDQNMFSDTMLNNILGPVAFFSLRGKEVDILRYNRQFYKEAKSPGFSRRMKSVQRVVLPEELPRLYAMFDKAVKSPLNGSSGVFTFLLPSGPVRQIFIRCFFLEQDEDGKRFYISIRDVTSTVAMEEDLSMLSQLSPVSIVLLRGEGSETSCRVMTHGLEKALGVTKEELERELNDGRFFKRAEAGERQRLKNLVKSAGSRTEKTSLSLKLRGADAEPLDVDLLFDRVTGLSGEAENVLVLHRKRA